MFLQFSLAETWFFHKADRDLLITGVRAVPSLAGMRMFTSGGVYVPSHHPSPLNQHPLSGLSSK